MKKICMIGHGMMGTWHSEALRHHPGADLHTLVGVEAGPAGDFAQRYGYKRATTDLLAAIRDPAIDAVIIAGPSESHARMALDVIEAGKPLLVEIPIGMTLEAAEAVVQAAERAGLPLAVSHPMRFRQDRHELLARVRSGEEVPRHVHGRFFIHRLVNVGATGIQRNWTDNILWHHTTHLLDFGLWLIGAGDPEAAERRIRRIQSFMPGLDPQTGIPMEIVVSIETEDDQTIVATGSYYARYRIYDVLAVTDRDSYGVDELTATLTTGAGSRPIPTEEQNAHLIARDFVDALNQNRPPYVTGRSVLPVMRVLDRVQAEWDGRFSARSIPGRPLDQLAVPIT